MVTVFTPIYNKAELIIRLFDSLSRQNCAGFE